MNIEENFDIPFVAQLAKHEKQIQQNYRPIIGVHKWFARRPGSLFRALILSEFVSDNIKDTYFEAHNLKGITIADPFIGGGTTIFEANRVGCEVIGYDINPMAYWVVKQELEQINLEKYKTTIDNIYNCLKDEIGHLYQTKCVYCGRNDAYVKYFIWVKTTKCERCGETSKLFPGFLLAKNKRHPKNVIICSNCGNLNEVEDVNELGKCYFCKSPLTIEGNAKRNEYVCLHCGEKNKYPIPTCVPPKHGMIAIEYYCSTCSPNHDGRFFKKPTEEDLLKYQETSNLLTKIKPRFIPNEKIPPGDETARLLKWGYRYYKQMFNDRQLLGLELLIRAIHNEPNRKIRHALVTNFSDLLRYQNMLCRYDTYALKSLDIFSIHGFPVSLMACESNLLGMRKDGMQLGSGGWLNIVKKFLKAKEYCDSPFETKIENGKKTIITIPGEWIGEAKNTLKGPERRSINLYCDSSTHATLEKESIDAVLTDPPYFANVQYAELMDFCFVWLRRLLKNENPIFKRCTTRNENELTGNTTLERGLNHFTEGLISVFTRFTKALKPYAPLVFTYHHNLINAYYPIAIALLDSGFVCTTVFPCPAEMRASIHISGTGSSTIDSVFVCRQYKEDFNPLANNIQKKITDDLAKLRSVGIIPTKGDIQCITYGHVIGELVLNLRSKWRSDSSLEDKFKKVDDAVQMVLNDIDLDQLSLKN